MNINDFVLYGNSCSNQPQYIYCTEQYDDSKLFKEYFNKNTEYKNSYIEEIVNSFADLVPVPLKEVDGYKIRLLSINDILEYDNAWDKKDSDTYFYTGNNFNDNFLGTWLMDTVENQCDNCSKFFVVKTVNNPEASIPNGIYLESGALGLSEIKPVIYAYKDSI